jgi:hypothetical protein
MDFRIMGAKFARKINCVLSIAGAWSIGLNLTGIVIPLVDQTVHKSWTEFNGTQSECASRQFIRPYFLVLILR